MNTEQVVAILRGAGLQAEIDTRRTKRAGFRVSQFNRSIVGVTSTTMTDTEWSTAMSALESAGLKFHYRSDEGRGCQVSA